MRVKSYIFVACWLAFAMLTSAMAEDAKPSEKPVRALIVTGVDFVGHPWKETAPALQRLLEQDKRIEARIIEDPEFLASPAVADYDVIFLHFYTEDHLRFKRDAEIRENLANLVKSGKGLVVLHLACGSFEDWPDYGNLIGRVWDRKTFHDARGPFAVHITQPQHPIVQGLQDFETDDELYICLTGDKPIEILATAHSKITDKDHPMAFVLEYGQGRVFHTPLGHDVRAFETPNVAEMLRRATLWTARRIP